MTEAALAVIDQEPETGTALQTNATRQMMPDEWTMLKELAVTLEAAGRGTGILPKGISNRYQILAILKKGRELGFAEMYSLEQIGMVNGKPLIQGQALLALIKSRHGPSAVTKIESTEQIAVYELRRAGAEPTRFQFTIEDAKRAGLLAKKGTWEQYPRVMLKWRCIAEGAREYFADTIAGLYLPDELDVPVTVTAGGEVEIDRDQWQPEPSGQEAFDQPDVSAGQTPVASDDTPAEPKTEEVSIDDERGQLLDAITQSLTKLSVLNMTTGTKLVTAWRTSGKHPKIAMDMRPLDQLSNLLAWSEAQLPAEQRAPLGQGVIDEASEPTDASSQVEDEDAMSF
jgi:hypothetical protein